MQQQFADSELTIGSAVGTSVGLLVALALLLVAVAFLVSP